MAVRLQTLQVNKITFFTHIFFKQKNRLVKILFRVSNFLTSFRWQIRPPRCRIERSMLRLHASRVSPVPTVAYLLAGCDEWVHFCGYFGSLLAYGCIYILALKNSDGCYFGCSVLEVFELLVFNVYVEGITLTL